MPLLTELRRSPWLAGALLLALTAMLVAPVVSVFGLRRWPLYAGLGAVLLLAFGSLERFWQGHALRGPGHARRGRLRLVPTGKRKGNGRPHDADPEDGGDDPRWVM